MASHTQDDDILQRREELPVEFSELGIDAVLMGHDHSYTRSFMMNGTTPVTTGYTADGSNQYASYTKDPASGEVFYLTANSASGSKFYSIKNLDFPFKAAANQESVPNITKIDVSEDSLIFTTYRTGGNNSVNDVVDTFTLNRAAAGQKPVITTTSLPEGTAGVSYSVTLEADGDEPITWSVESGELPEGLELSNEGVISGTPAASATGTFNVVIKAENSVGSGTKAFVIEIKPAQEETQVSNVVINVGGDESQRMVTWYGDSANYGELQLAPASDMTGEDFPAENRKFQAVIATSSGISGSYVNKTTVTGLAANIEYIYRVGNFDGWSDIYRFSTGSFDGSFSFLLAGDPQIGSSGNIGNDTAGWVTTLNKAEEWFPKVNFLISAGDQVEHATSETEYAGFLEPEYLRSMTLATNIGNHDSAGVNYKEHFSVPNPAENEGDTNAGGDYWYSYNGILFMSINSNNLSTAQHKAFLEKAVEEYKNENNGEEPLWKIVTFHHSVYSTASHTQDSDILQRREELPVVFSELGIDAVLMGHDHVYTRSLMMNGTTPVTEGYTASGSNRYASYTKDPTSGEVFYLTANSASGSKFYAIKNLDFPFKAVDNQESVPNLTKIDVSEDSLIFTTYRTGTSNSVKDVVDTFTLNRTEAKQQPVITTTSLPDGTAGVPYSVTLEADGDKPITWSVENGELPDGLVLSDTGVISGTPTASAIGTFDFTVKAENSAGSDTKSFRIEIGTEPSAGTKPSITTSSLPGGRIKSSYGPVILKADGDKPITWSVENGELPGGLTLSGEGVISGTPTASAIGSFDFTVKAENNAGYDTKELSIEIRRKPKDDDSKNDGNGGNKTPVTDEPKTEEYTASIKFNGAESDFPVTVDKEAGSASVDLSSQQENIISGGTASVTIPSISGVNEYGVGIPVPYLSTVGAQGSLKLNTDNGSITVPSNMLTGVAGAGGNKAEITIGKGDMSKLPESARASVGDRPLIQLTLAVDGNQVQWNNPDAPVTLSIPYEPTDDELKNPENIIIWYIDGNGSAIPVTDGYYDPAEGTVTFTTTHFSYYAVGYNLIRFGDVAENAWYYKPVSFVAARKITSGTGSGNYSPDAKLTRGEFLVMLMRSYGITEDANPSDNFSDAGSTYYTGYLAAAKRLGISSGVGGNMFAPGKEITRQEMFTMLYNALKTIGKLPSGSSGKSLSDFTDSGLIESWAEEATALMVETGAITGNAGKLSPGGMTNRAEMAQVLYKLLSK